MPDDPLGVFLLQLFGFWYHAALFPRLGVVDKDDAMRACFLKLLHALESDQQALGEDTDATTLNDAADAGWTLHHILLDSVDKAEVLLQLPRKTTSSSNSDSSSSSPSSSSSSSASSASASSSASLASRLVAITLAVEKHVERVQRVQSQAGERPSLGPIPTTVSGPAPQPPAFTARAVFPWAPPPTPSPLTSSFPPPPPYVPSILNGLSTPTTTTATTTTTTTNSLPPRPSLFEKPPSLPPLLSLFEKPLSLPPRPSLFDKTPPVSLLGNTSTDSKTFFDRLVASTGAVSGSVGKPTTGGTGTGTGTSTGTGTGTGTSTTSGSLFSSRLPPPATLAAARDAAQTALAYATAAKAAQTAAQASAHRTQKPLSDLPDEYLSAPCDTSALTPAQLFALVRPLVPADAFSFARPIPASAMPVLVVAAVAWGLGRKGLLVPPARRCALTYHEVVRVLVLSGEMLHREEEEEEEEKAKTQDDRFYAAPTPIAIADIPYHMRISSYLELNNDRPPRPSYVYRPGEPYPFPPGSRHERDEGGRPRWMVRLEEGDDSDDDNKKKKKPKERTYTSRRELYYYSKRRRTYVPEPVVNDTNTERSPAATLGTAIASQLPELLRLARPEFHPDDELLKGVMSQKCWRRALLGSKSRSRSRSRSRSKSAASPKAESASPEKKPTRGRAKTKKATHNHVDGAAGSSSDSESVFVRCCGCASDSDSDSDAASCSGSVSGSDSDSDADSAVLDSDLEADFVWTKRETGKTACRRCRRQDENKTDDKAATEAETSAETSPKQKHRRGRSDYVLV